MRGPRPTRARRGGAGALGALAVVVLLLGSALVLYGLPGALAAPAPTGASTHSAGPNSKSSAVTKPLHARSASPPAPRPSSGPVASGRGTFFADANLSQPGPGQRYCFNYSYSGSYSTCGNTTVDPSINVTSSGTLGVAFAAVSSFTNCGTVANISNYTTSVIGFQSSTNGGTVWSPVVYLANANCSAGLNLTDAWEPTLTSLSNGTFVLAYMEFGVEVYPGCTGCRADHIPGVYPFEMTQVNLVVQESYNGGSTWSNAKVVNASYNANGTLGLCSQQNGWPAFHPSIAASGNNLYLAWENLSNPYCYGAVPYSAAVNYMFSTNGGATWSNATQFPTIRGKEYYGTGILSYSVDPFVLAGSNGQVYVSYTTGYNQSSTPHCLGTSCFYGLWTMDVEVAVSSNGTGAPFTVATAEANVPIEFGEGCGPSYFGCAQYGVDSQVGYNGVNGQVYLIYQVEQLGYYCYPRVVDDCFDSIAPTIWFQNSSNNGANWSNATSPGGLVNASGGPEGSEWYATMAVDHNGTVHVFLSYYNESYCQFISIYNFTYCDGYEEIYVNSTNGGASWNAPVLVSPWVIGPFDEPYRGEYDTAAVAPSGRVYVAWDDSTCAGSTASPGCYYLNPYQAEPNTTVVVSWLYEGAGVTLTFSETGLAAGTNWAVDIQGNVREGNGTLTVTGVPPAQPMLWTVPWVNSSYGIAWEPAPGATTPTSPASFTTNATLTYTFTEFIELVVAVNPPLPTYILMAGYNEATYSMSPLPGFSWVAVGSSFTLAVTPQPISCTRYCDYYNLTWLAWTGTGNGSISTNATSITFTVGTSPVNETANFVVTGFCSSPFGNGTIVCDGIGEYPLTYHESGLPNGTTWGVTSVVNSTASGVVVNESSTPWLNTTVGPAAVEYTAWTVPASSGMEWVPSATTPASPVQEPLQTVVNLTYTLVRTTSAEFVANFTALGLPNGTSWSADVGNASYAVTQGNLSVTVPGGVARALNGSPVYTEDGIGYYAASVSVEPYVVNETWANTTTVPDAYVFNGSARIIVHYAPMYWLEVAASSGGVVLPASRWVEDGAPVVLNATAHPGSHFLDWTGAGPGATTSAQAHNASTTIRPTGPVSEFATFRTDPQPTWNVTVRATGLPNGTGFTVTVGNSTYTGTNGTLTIGELRNGSYAFNASDSYASNDSGTRWVATSWNVSNAVREPSGLTIRSNATVWVNFTTEYVLTVATTPDGTVTPSLLLGSTWEDAGTGVTLLASPSYHFKFVGWNASGNGSVKGRTGSITVHMDGPLWESATFEYRVFPPPAVYTLTVTETGLPHGVSWNISAGAGNASAAGATTSLTLPGLNGSYTLTVATIYPSVGTRFLANGSSPLPVTVTANRTASVAFQAEYALTVSGSLGGTVSGGGTSWESSGASATLTATPAAGYTFVSWNGTTNSTSARLELTTSGPVNETASFVPVVAKSTTGSASAGQGPALALLAALLAVGLVAGLVLGRRSGRTPPAASSSEDGDGTSWTEDPGADSVPADSPGDDIYGENAPTPAEPYDEGVP
jgi:hypothetical protein